MASQTGVVCGYSFILKWPRNSFHKYFFTFTVLRNKIVIHIREISIKTSIRFSNNR